MADDYMNELRCIIAGAIIVQSAAKDPDTEFEAVEDDAESNSVGCDIITNVRVDGCDARRRKRARALAVNVVTITFKFSTSTSENEYQTSQGLYDAATTSLKEATGAITAAMAATCGCEIEVEAIRVAMVKRWAPLDTIAEVEEEPTKHPFYGGGDCPNGCSGHGACSTNGCLCCESYTVVGDRVVIVVSVQFKSDSTSSSH